MKYISGAMKPKHLGNFIFLCFAGCNADTPLPTMDWKSNEGQRFLKQLRSRHDQNCIIIAKTTKITYTEALQFAAY